MPTRNGWTPQRRARQAARIHDWQPWRQATGPKTPAGKARASRNGWKGGQRTMLRMLARALREQHDTLAGIPGNDAF